MQEPAGVAVGDWDGDGAVDLAVTTTSGKLLILHGHGDGTFTLTQKIDVPIFAMNPPPSGSPLVVTTGDMNGDGFPDLVATAVSDHDDNRVSVLLGHGDGTFGPPIDAPYSFGSRGATLADFDGDGKLDILWFGVAESFIGVMRGAGDGTLLPPLTYASPTYTWAVTVGDVNGDGVRDLVVISDSGEPQTLANTCHH